MSTRIARGPKGISKSSLFENTTVCILWQTIHPIVLWRVVCNSLEDDPCSVTTITAVIVTFQQLFPGQNGFQFQFHPQTHELVFHSQIPPVITHPIGLNYKNWHLNLKENIHAIEWEKEVLFNWRLNLLLSNEHKEGMNQLFSNERTGKKKQKELSFKPIGDINTWKFTRNFKIQYNDRQKDLQKYRLNLCFTKSFFEEFLIV